MKKLLIPSMIAITLALTGAAFAQTAPAHPYNPGYDYANTLGRTNLDAAATTFSFGNMLNSRHNLCNGLLRNDEGASVNIALLASGSNGFDLALHNTKWTNFHDRGWARVQLTDNGRESTKIVDYIRIGPNELQFSNMGNIMTNLPNYAQLQITLDVGSRVTIPLHGTNTSLVDQLTNRCK